jgi:predicted dehydrogenase
MDLSLVQAPRPENPRPVVVIGAGGIVRNAHLPAYAKGGFPVVALADPVPGKAEALAHDFGIQRSFDSLSAALAFAPRDVIFDVAVPASEITSVLRAIPDGSGVLLQKPMGESLRQAGEIRDLCRAKELTAAVNFQLRYAPNILLARAMHEKGALGELHDMEVQVRTMMPWEQWPFLASAPRLEILYHSIHYIDLVRSWFGNPRAVSGKTVRNPGTPSLAATKSIIVLDYGDWKRAFIATNHNYRFGAEMERAFVQWEGTSGAMRATLGVILDYPHGKPDRLQYSTSRDPGWKDAPVSGQWFPDAFAGTMGSLQAYIEGSIDVLPTGVDDAFQTMRVVEALYDASDGRNEPIAWNEG